MSDAMFTPRRALPKSFAAHPHFKSRLQLELLRVVAYGPVSIWSEGDSL
jgi:hypothetical protein